MPPRFACHRSTLALVPGLVAFCALHVLAGWTLPPSMVSAVAAGAGISEPAAWPGPQASPDQAATDVVPVSVRVVDRNRRPVRDLTAADFTVLEDGVPQTIRYFSVNTLESGPAQPGPALIAPEAVPLAPQGHRLFVLAFGSGKLEQGSNTITELLSLVRTRLLPQDQVAVFAYDRALEFSSDHQRLAEVLERFKRSHEDIDFEISQQMGPTGMAPLYGARVLPRRLQTKIDQLLFGPAGTTATPTAAEVVDHGAFGTLPLDDFIAGSAVTVEDQGNLVALLEYLRHFQGRKDLLFVTEKGLLWPGEETDRALAQLANEGRVAIHTLQVGGIPTAEPGRELEATHQMARSFSNLRNMAELTGGLSSITESSRTALENLDAVTRTTYLLGYRPSNAAWDDRYRTIAVRVKRPDAVVLFRHGYRREQVPAGFNRRSHIATERLRAAAAFRREVNDIRVRASATVRAGDLAVEGTVNLSKVKLELVEGAHVGLLNLGVISLDSGLNALGAHLQELPIKVTAEELKQFQRNGMPYSIKVPLFRGMSSIRFVVYDYGSDLVGRVDTTLY